MSETTPPQPAPPETSPPGDDDAIAATPEAQASPKRPWWRRLLRGLGIFALVLLLLIGAVLLFSQTQLFRDIARDQVIKATGDLIQGELTIGRIGGNLFTGISVHDVEVRDAAGQLVALVPEVSVSYSLLDMLEQQVTVTDVAILRPVIVARFDEAGELNVANIIAPQPETPKDPDPGKLHIVVERAKLADATLLYIDERDGEAPAPSSELLRLLGPDAREGVRAALLAELDATPAPPSETTPSPAEDDSNAEPAPDAPAAPPEESPSESPSDPPNDAPEATPAHPLAARPPRVAALRDLSLEASARVAPIDGILANVGVMTGRVVLNTLPGERALRGETMEARVQGRAIQLTHAGLRLEDVVGFDAMSAAIVLLAQGVPEGGVPLESAHLKLDGLRLAHDIAARVAPQTPLRADVLASMEVAMVDGEVAFALDASAGDANHVELRAHATQLVEAVLGDDSARPRYTLGLKVKDLRPSEAVQMAALPDFSLRSLRLAVSGEGLEPRSANATLFLEAVGGQLEGVKLEGALLRARLANRELKIERAEALTPYIDAFAKGKIDLDGKLMLRLDARSGPRHKRSVRVAERTVRQQDASLTLDLNASLALDQAPGLAMIRDLRLEALWALAGFEAEAIQVQRSGRRALVQISSPDATQRRISYDIDASVSGLRAPGLQVQQAALRSRGAVVLDAALAAPMRALRALQIEPTQVQLVGVRAAGARVGRASASLEVTPQAGGLRYAMALREASDIASGESRVKRASARLQGEVALNGRDTLPAMIEQLSASGVARVDGVSVPGASVAAAVVMIGRAPPGAHDRSGTIQLSALAQRTPQASGWVRVQAVDVRAADEHLRGVDVYLRLEEGWGFEVIGAVTGRRRAPSNLKLNALGNLQNNFQTLSLREARLTLPNGRAWTVAASRVDLRGGGVDIDNFRLTQPMPQGLPNGSLSIEGGYRPRGRQDLKVKARAISLGQALNDFGVEHLAPEVFGELEVLDLALEGTARAPEISLVLVVRDLMVAGLGPFDIDMRGTYKDARLTLNKIDVKGWETQLLTGQARLPVRLDLERQRVSYLWSESMLGTMAVGPINFDALKVPQLKPFGLQGKLEAVAVLSGTLAAPTLDMTLNTNDLGAKLVAGGQKVRLSGLTLDASASYKPPVGGAGGIKVDLGAIWLATEAERAAGEKRIELSFETPMPIAQWMYETLERGVTPDIGAQAMRQPFKLLFAVRDLELRKLDIDPLLRKPDVAGLVNLEVRGQGTLEDPRITLNARIGEDIDEAAKRLGQPKEEGATRNPECPKGGLGYDRYRDIAINLKASFEREQLIVEPLRLNWDCEDILLATANQPVPLRAMRAQSGLPDLPLNMSLQVHPFPLNKLQAISYDFAGLRGSVQGQIFAQGTLSSPRVVGEVRLVETELGKGRTGNITASVDLTGDGAAMRANVWDSGVEYLTLEAIARLNLNLVQVAAGADPLKVSDEVASRPLALGLVELAPGRTMQLAIRTADRRPVSLANLIPTSLTRKMLKRIEGQLMADLRVWGNPGDLQASGVIALEEGLFDVTELGRVFEDVSIQISPTNNALTISTAALREGQSMMRATGSVGLRGPGAKKANLTLLTDNFNLGGFADFPAFVSSRVDVSADLGATPISAKVGIKELVVQIPAESGKSVHSTQVSSDVYVLTPTAKGPGEDFDTLFDQVQSSLLEMNVEVNIARDSQVFHPLGRIVMGGDITMALSGGVARLGGAVETVGGQVEFLGKQFRVGQGLVTFTGSDPPDPRLQLEAEYLLDRALVSSIGQPTEGRDPKVFVRVTGTTTNPRLRLRSDPEMSDTDILYVLATGKPPQSAGVGQDAGVVDAAIGAASGLFAGLLVDELAGQVPFQVSLDTGDEGLSDASFEVGYYINPDTYVTYRYRLGGSSGLTANIVKIEYRVAASWTLELEISDNDPSQFNVFWDIF